MKIGLRTVKTAVAATLAMIVAYSLQLLYAPSAGIIAVLSVGNTKKTSLMTAIKRIASLLLATAIAFVCFQLFGFHPIAFGIYLLLFISISVKFGLEDGIVVNSVLVTHYLIEASFAPKLLLNEFLLMIIGVGFALLFNLVMPDMQKKLKEDQLVIEEMFRKLLRQMALHLNQVEQAGLRANCQGLLEFIFEAQKRAKIDGENQWLDQNVYFTEYFAMRKTQLRVLGDMITLLDKIFVEEAFIEDIRYLLEMTADEFAEFNDGKQILTEIMQVYENYRKKPLPQTREEFENRARLFQFLQSFTSFIEIKAEFSET
ncbi:aromatic acid exporter family protein [Enterococcus timonensis]|uniref:aromatic acid exporter family protein n=1 Tax=Enterococcus timonensis TaxID=1852364 RepID=UPI0008DA890A|nr:aromatic acid exporter family protein [Enterococcus timonensis]